MQARRAARELALILFSQMNTIENINNWDYQDIVLKSVRTLTNNSSDELKMATNSILEIKEMIEQDHGCEITCDWCNTHYEFSEDELKELYNENR